MTSYKTFYLLVLLLIAIFDVSHKPVLASIEAVEFNDPKLLSRYQSLIAELRCLVCQNQNLADSDADLAKGLRRKTEEMLKANKTDKEILSYMQERYGDFVLYRPPLNAMTTFLWLGPFVLLLIAFISLILMIKRQQSFTVEKDTSSSTNELSQIRDRLKNTSTTNTP